MQERKERVKEVLDWLKKNRIFNTNRVIAEAMGYNPCVISHVTTGKIKISSSFVKALCDIYPGINYDWIWDGRGEMILGSCQDKERYDPNSPLLDRYTFVMLEVVKTMRHISLLVNPMNQEINRLKEELEVQKKVVAELKARIKKIKTV